MQKETKEEISVRNNQAASDKIVEKAAEKKLKEKINKKLKLENTRENEV